MSSTSWSNFCAAVATNHPEFINLHKILILKKFFTTLTYAEWAKFAASASFLPIKNSNFHPAPQFRLKMILAAFQIIKTCKCKSPTRKCRRREKLFIRFIKTFLCASRRFAGDGNLWNCNFPFSTAKTCLCLEKAPIRRKTAEGELLRRSGKLLYLIDYK